MSERQVGRVVTEFNDPAYGRLRLTLDVYHQDACDTTDFESAQPPALEGLSLHSARGWVETVDGKPRVWVSRDDWGPVDTPEFHAPYLRLQPGKVNYGPYCAVMNQGPFTVRLRFGGQGVSPNEVRTVRGRVPYQAPNWEAVHYARDGRQRCGSRREGHVLPSTDAVGHVTCLGCLRLLAADGLQLAHQVGEARAKERSAGATNYTNLTAGLCGLAVPKGAWGWIVADPTGVVVRNGLTVARARELGVCRICHCPDTLKPGDTLELDHGREYAHGSCLGRNIPNLAWITHRHRSEDGVVALCGHVGGSEAKGVNKWVPLVWDWDKVTCPTCLAKRPTEPGAGQETPEAAQPGPYHGGIITTWQPDPVRTKITAKQVTDMTEQLKPTHPLPQEPARVCAKCKKMPHERWCPHRD